MDETAPVMTEEEKTAAWNTFDAGLKVEQMLYKQNRASSQAWDTKSHENFYKYNAERTSSIDKLVDRHCETHFPIRNLKVADAVEPEFNSCLSYYADQLGLAKDQVYRVFTANMCYLGSNAGAMTMDLARIVGDLIAVEPVHTCARIIFSNAGGFVSAAAGELKRGVPGVCAVL